MYTDFSYLYMHPLIIHSLSILLFVHSLAHFSKTIFYLWQDGKGSHVRETVFYLKATNIANPMFWPWQWTGFNSSTLGPFWYMQYTEDTKELLRSPKGPHSSLNRHHKHKSSQVWATGRETITRNLGSVSWLSFQRCPLSSQYFPPGREQHKG